MGMGRMEHLDYSMVNIYELMSAPTMTLTPPLMKPEYSPEPHAPTHPSPTPIGTGKKKERKKGFDNSFAAATDGGEVGTVAANNGDLIP